jgi:uncharacterized protein YwgA
VLDLAGALRTHGSSCGETAIQKGVYFLKELTHVPVSFEYVLYRHGPFSFDLRDALSAMRADEMISVTPQLRYGVTIEPTAFGRAICERFPKTLARHRDAISFVSEHVAHKGVVDLERMATALYVALGFPQESTQSRARRIHELKPHISIGDAQEAVHELDSVSDEWAAARVVALA